MKYWIQIGIVVLILGAVLFNCLDAGLGTTEISTENVVVTETYHRTVKSGNAAIQKYYIIVKTENGKETLSVTHDFYNKVNINDEIEVEKTITQTKWTDETVINYSIN